jgi:hypothetical protein
MELEERWFQLASSGLGQKTVADCFEHRNEPSEYVTGADFLN